MYQNYRVMGGGKGGVYKTLTPTIMTEEELRESKAQSSFYWATKTATGLYHLRSKAKTYARDVQFFEIHCPECHCTMEHFEPIHDGDDFLFVCRNCFEKEII